MRTVFRGERWPEAVATLASASLACAALVAVRVTFSQSGDYTFLIWNLVLAWVPFLLALVAWFGYQLAWPRPVLTALGGLWLLFLPNAPYILTDFIHLGRGYGGAPLAFDAAAISACALTGLMLGFASLYLIHAVIERILSHRASWTLVFVILALSSLGIYLGRFQRLNSWDAVRHPTRLLAMVYERSLDPFGNLLLIAIAVAFTAFLTVGYLAMYELLRPHAGSYRRSPDSR
jgi:uncharacterized membrane protein